MSVPLSPVLQHQGVYPFVRLHQAAARVAADGVEIIDFGAGDPRGEAEPFIQEALTRALRQTSGYPLAQGLPELREAIAGWCDRRFGVERFRAHFTAHCYERHAHETYAIGLTEEGSQSFHCRGATHHRASRGSRGWRRGRQRRATSPASCDAARSPPR